MTPYELEVALQAEQSWTGRYVLDFEILLTDYAQAGADFPLFHSFLSADMILLKMV